ncbi:MAG TPA: hypothetical protein VFH87_12440 [Candidatus Udaeobacter sp.]|nr:hypothetical protein [Candidatus Udaeobacter sp.]
MPTVVWSLYGTGTTIHLGAGGVCMPVCDEYGAEVWYAGDPCGVMTIPAITGLCRLTL